MDHVILTGLATDIDFSRKVIPHIKEEYFTSKPFKIVFDAQKQHLMDYNALANEQVLEVAIEDALLTEIEHKASMEFVSSIKDFNRHETEWLVDRTEKWCQERALYLAIMESVNILTDRPQDKNAIPEKVKDALSVTFDTSVGHEYFDDAELRHDFYHIRDSKVPCDIEGLMRHTGGGVSTKTLNILMATCVHPSTSVTMKIDDGPSATTHISNLEVILDNLTECQVYVDSPDGWVEVEQFNHIGDFSEYVLTTESGLKVRSNEGHRYQTDQGWMSAKDIMEKGPTNILTKSGPSIGEVVMTGGIIPIVDISVDHPNHRYYTNDVCSHNTGGCKTLTKCHLAASAIRMGQNVLYITNEEREEKIALRIDANIFDMPMDEVRGLDKGQYLSKIDMHRNKMAGKLVIKEYATATASAMDYRHLLEELALKKNFKPDVIFVDYINICKSSRVKNDGGNSYGYIKSVAEELRGLACEYDVPIWSSTQGNRSAYGNSNAGLDNMSESMGLGHTVDLFISIFSDEGMDEQNLIRYRVLKTRYGQNGDQWLCNIDRDKMKISDYGDTYAPPDVITLKSERPDFSKPPPPPPNTSFLD